MTTLTHWQQRREVAALPPVDRLDHLPPGTEEYRDAWAAAVAQVEAELTATHWLREELRREAYTLAADAQHLCTVLENANDRHLGDLVDQLRRIHTQLTALTHDVER